jgi:hypothetical protein
MQPDLMPYSLVADSEPHPRLPGLMPKGSCQVPQPSTINITHLYFTLRLAKSSSAGIGPNTQPESPQTNMSLVSHANSMHLPAAQPQTGLKSKKAQACGGNNPKYVFDNSYRIN